MTSATTNKLGRRLLGRAFLGAAASASLSTTFVARTLAAPLGKRVLAVQLSVEARVVATGIPGASAVSAVGVFHSGGPFRDNAEFAAFTGPGRVLDSRRVLVASASNFGSPLAHQDLAPGTILSIDPRGAMTMAIPPEFAAAGGQVSAVDGYLQVYTAQSPAFANELNNPGALTSTFPSVSSPRAMSLNNGFGRPWFASSPTGLLGAGTESVTDPDGRPLAAAPSGMAGGVFAGASTNRRPTQDLPGALECGAVGTALLGKSPDGSGRAVFVVACADGALLQVHVAQGVDGLAPAGTIGPLGHADALGAGELSAERTGVIFNWVPDPIVYIADPTRNAVVAVTLNDDGRVFNVERVRRFDAPELDMPVDLAAAVPEVVNPAFSSNTTLAGAADFYIANRGNGTIARMRQDGRVVAVRQVAVPGLGPLGPGRLNGIAVSPDTETIWVTVSGALPDTVDSEGALLALPAFGS